MQTINQNEQKHISIISILDRYLININTLAFCMFCAAVLSAVWFTGEDLVGIGMGITLSPVSLFLLPAGLWIFFATTFDLNNVLLLVSLVLIPFSYVAVVRGILLVESKAKWYRIYFLFLLLAFVVMSVGCNRFALL